MLFPDGFVSEQREGRDEFPPCVGGVDDHVNVALSRGMVGGGEFLCVLIRETFPLRGRIFGCSPVV